MKRKSDCPVNYGLEIFGDRWTLLIIRDLMFKGKHYYGEYVNSEEKIATNLLADRLHMLEKEGIISRSRDKIHKQKIVYNLTRKGIDLLPLMVELIMWSAKYDSRSAADKAFTGKVKKDKAGFLKELAERLAAS